MDKEYEAKHHLAEENHCWYKARRDILIKLLEKYPKNSKILDIGCSGGPLISSLNKIGFNNIYGIDISEEAIKICEKRGLRNVLLMRGEKIDFKNEEFDVIIASDILEHVKDENIALKEWRRILRRNGKMIVFVPAFNFLWSSHDEQNHHYRRYSKATLAKSLKEADFSIERASYWNLSLFFPTFLIRMAQKIINPKSRPWIRDSRSRKESGQKNDQLRTLSPLFDNLIFKILKLENWMLKKINFPFGVSVFAVVRK